MGSFRVRVYLLAFLAVQATAEKCKPSTCFSSNTSPLFAATSGQEFTYDFESTATAQLVNKDTVETSVAIKGQAVVSAGENCGYTLTLKGVTAFGSDNSKLAIQKDFGLPVQFTLSGDELSPEICADASEGTFSLNVKRGVISALQNALGRSTDLDIFGKCPVTSTSSVAGGVTTVSSSRDLDQCAYREKLSSGLIQGVVAESSSIKTSPILNGKVESDAKFHNGALQSIELRENYNFLPFSTHNHGARAKVVTKLNLKNTATGQAAAPKTPTARTLLFENTNSNLVNPKVNIKDSIKTAFGKTLQEFTGEGGVISSKSAAAFAEIIRLMRLAKRSDLLTAYQDLKKGTLSDLQKSPNAKAISRSIFLDALFRTGTGESIAALADLAKKELNPKEQQLMYLSFNLAQSVTKESITSLAKLFNDNLPKEAYLSIGSVVNKYCRDRGCEAGDVKAIADKFISKIPKDCATSSRKDEEQLVAVLKGIRNSQTILNSALDRIIQCASNKNPNRVRVAAIQAFTANPCNKKLQQAATTVLKNREEDSEVRTEAYLAAIECPSGGLANDIQALLDSEPINQVGSFINTHLNSIKASTDPKREAARVHFKNLRTNKKFPFDPRRYSFNREVSYAIDSLGLGSAIDTSVIYSQQSFLPRSGKLNVTGNLFGSAFNILEVSARQENLESLLEHYFGPRGVFSRMSKQDLFDAVKKEISEISRHKRALPEDLAAFDKQVKLSSEFDREPDLDLSVKVFGSELYFLSLSHNIPATPADLVKLFASEFSKGTEALKNFQYNFENHALWLDAEFVYPTALGLPFKLSSVGSSAVTVDLAGSVDIKQLVEDPLNSKVQLQFSPAANIFISGQLGFNAYAYETALEVAGTIYTNTGANTTVEIQGGKTVVVSTIPTVKDQYVVDLTHQISTVSQESGREAVKVPAKFKSSQERETDLCFDQVEFLTGFTFCTHVIYTPLNASENALWPLYGNNKFNIRLEMVDALTFRGEYDDKDPSRPAINLFYNTPKDGKERQTSLKFLSSFNPDHLMAGFDLSVPVQVESPFKIDASAGLLNQENEKKIYVNGNYLGGNFKYELGFKRKGNEIEPILKFNSDMTYLEGKILEQKTDNGVKYTLKQVKFGRDTAVTVVDGSIEVNGPKISANLKFKQGSNAVDLIGSVGYQQGQLDSDLQLRSDQFPTANGKLVYGLKFSDKNVGNDLTIVWDKDVNSKTNRLEWNQAADWSDREVFKTKNALSVGKFNAAGKFNGEFGKKIVNFDAGLDYGNQKAELKVDNKYSQKVPHDYETTIYAAANQRSIKIEAKREIEGESSKLNNKLELSTGLKLEVNGKVSHKFQLTNADVALQGVFIPGPKKDQTKATFNLKNTEKDHSASSKVTVGKNEFAHFESKLTYGNQMVGSLKGSVSDTVNVDGTFQSTNGKGTATINGSIKDRKVKLDTQFTIQKPNFDFSSDIFYDYEKDNTKKVHISTNNNIQDNSFDSKNVVEVFNERYGFNANANKQGTFMEGQQKAGAEVQLPTGRKFSFTADREAKSVNKKRNGSFHLTATDEKPNKEQRQAILDLKVHDVSPKEGFFDFAGSLKYRDYDNKDLKGQLALKNLKKGHFSTANVALKVDGQLIPEAATFNVNIDEYCENHAIYSLNGKYGSLGDIDAKGKFYVATKERPHSHDFNGVLNVPKTKLQKLSVSSVGQLTEPADREGSYIVTYTGSIDLAGKKVEVGTDLTASRSKGSGKVKLQLPEIRPISVETSFSCNHKDKADGSLVVNYGDNKKLQTNFNVQREGDTSVEIDAALKGDLEQFKEITFNLNAKRPSPNEVVSKITLKADAQQYSLDYEHRASDKEPKLSVIVTRPQGTSKIIADAQVVSQLKGKGKLEIENVESFNLKSNIDGDLSSIENFHLQGEIDSPQIGLNKFTFDIRSKDGAAGRTGFDYKFTKDGKHFVSGSTDFTTKLDKGRTILEGKSQIKLTDGKSDEVSFKLIRNVFDLSRDGETGFGGILNVFVGPRNFAGELKLTNKELHAKYTGCEANNRCTNLETKSILEKSTLEDFKHNLVITVDLREVGFSHEFGLKADTSRTGWKFQHSVDAYLQSQDKPEYQYSLFINPTESGALLSLPTRHIALDASYKYPERSPFGVYDGTLAFYVDKKNKPRQKTEVGFRGELNKGDKNQITGKADLTFEHPRVKKLRVGGEFGANADTANVKSKLEFDVFTNPNDAIIVTTNFGNTDTSLRGFNFTTNVEVNSKGLGLNLKYHDHVGFSFDRRVISLASELTLPVDDFHFGLHTNINEKSGEFLVIAFNQDLLKSSANYDIEKHDFNVETTVRYIGAEPIVQKSSITGLTEGSFTLRKGQLLEVDSGYAIGKDIHLLVKGSGKEIFNGKIALDTSHFLTSNYHIDDAGMKTFTGQLQEQAKKDFATAENDVKDKFAKLQTFWNQKLEKIQNASPDFARLQEEYNQEVQNLVEELKQDPAIKKLIDQTAAIVGELAKTFNTLSNAVKEQLATIDAAVKQYYGQAVKALNENILPEIKKLYESLVKLASEVYEQTVKILTAAFERVSKALKTFEDDFNKISKAIREATHSTYEAIGNYIKEITQEIKELFETLKKQLETLPGLDYLKEKYAELLGDFSPLETIKVVVAEFVSSLAQIVPEEIKPLFDKISDYVQKKLAGENVDDLAVLKELYKALLNALSGFKKEYIDGTSSPTFSSPINLNLFKRLPPFITNIRLSAFNQLSSEPIVSLSDLYLYRPYAFNPIEAIPPFKLHGEVSDGSHIFTFDGRHLTFPGKCSYILARDFVDGNFSIVANYADGKLKSISLTDKSGYVEISNDGTLQLNGKASEYPVHGDTLHAWRSYHNFFLHSVYGAHLQCSDNLRTCHFRVSGFYSGKLRGLLGNGNNEPYDDYLLPNDKITESTSELGNAYRTSQNCEAVTASGDDHQKSQSNEFCTQYFGRDSSLRLCFLFIKPANYREACEHATHGDAEPQKAACGIASTYASRCRQENIPVFIPKACSSCSVGSSSLDVGDNVAVQVPQKQADVVVVFDTNLGKDLSLVQDVVSELKRELKNNGITDVHIASIGFNADYKFFSQYTTNGKFDFKGNFAEMKSGGPKVEPVLQTGIANVDNVLLELEKHCKTLRSDLGISSDAQAFQKALRYPFRPTATKTILAFRTDGIPYTASAGKVLSAEVSGKIAHERGVGIFAVLPINVTEPADRTKNIVGFNNDVVLLLNEKKRPNMGSVEIAGKLKYEPDLGVDLTKKYGYVFNLNTYQTDKKKFVGVVGYVLADVISRTEIQSECKCVLSHGLYPETNCKATEQKLLAPAKKAQKGR